VLSEVWRPEAGAGEAPAVHWVAVLPTSGNLFRPNQPKNSAADEKIRPLTVFFNKGFLKKDFYLKKIEFIHVFTSLVLTVNKRLLWELYTSKKFGHFSATFCNSTKNSAADFSGRSYFYGAAFVFCGRNFGQLATLVGGGRSFSVNM
jgi:hypothetical protein